MISMARIAPDVPTIRIHSIRSPFGNVEQHPIRESRIVQTVYLLMNLLLRMHLWRCSDYWQRTLMMYWNRCLHRWKRHFHQMMLKRVNKEISNHENHRNKLTYIMLDDKISKEAYDEKYDDICKKLSKI